MADYQKSFTVLAEELISPPFAFLWKVFEPPPANLAGLSLLLLLRLGKEEKHWKSNGTWWEQVAADQQALDFFSSKSKFNLFL